MDFKDVILAADRVLDRLANMSDEELLSELDACAGGAVAYAFNEKRISTRFNAQAPC